MANRAPWNSFPQSVTTRILLSKIINREINYMLKKTFCIIGLVLSHSGISSMAAQNSYVIGREVAIERHLEDGEEFSLPLQDVLAHGRDLFNANWTVQEGGGRPLTKGTGGPLADLGDPLVFPRNFNRISAPDANSCFGCHNTPSSGGAGDIVANVFVLGQRFDFATLGGDSDAPTKSSVDESGKKASLQQIANSRVTLGMFGSGFIEMLARQITEDLQRIRNDLTPGESVALESKGIRYGTLSRGDDGTWNTDLVMGIPAPSLTSTSADNPPSLIIRPFHQAGAVVSLRQFSNNAFNHHHGIQPTERFGRDVDPDGDGFVNEMTRADVTAVSLFQATLAVPGRMIPNIPAVEEAVLTGEARFQAIGCAECHVPALPLTDDGWKFTEPNPYNPPDNLRPGDAPNLTVDLTDETLPLPRLSIVNGTVWAPAFTDLKLHDITSGPNDPSIEPLDMNQPGGSEGFFAGNSKFLTRKLWDLANKPNYFHHGQFTTIRQAILTHSGEALYSREAFESLSEFEKDSIIEFLKTLRVLPQGTPSLIVDETGNAKEWPPNRFISVQHEPGQVALTWQGSTGLYQLSQMYQLQRCENLGEEWQDVGDPTLNTSVVDPTERKRAFYRVLILK